MKFLNSDCKENNVLDINYSLKTYTKYLIGLQAQKIIGFDINFTLDKFKRDSFTLFQFFRFTNNDSFVRYEQLLDVISVDKLDKQNRFQIAYNLVSITRIKRFIVRIALAISSITAYSLSSIYASAIWLERECWDLMGLPFLNHPDLRRILTNYGFEGHPLRKDFPAIGFYQVRYDEFEKTVVEEPITLTQEFRYFDFLSPWEKNNNLK